jgi:hypothetical protein
MSDIVEMIRGESEVALVRPEWVEDWKGLGWALKGEGIVPAAATPLDADGLKVGKGPGGKFYVKQGKVNLKGPFATEAEAEAAMVTPDGAPVPIPEAWEAMTDDELVKLAGELSGEPITELNGETPAQSAKSIIQAAVDDRASKA